MKNNQALTQQGFDTLLNWLSDDREEAGEKYESIRQGLLRFFYFKGCSHSEDLTDETINRVIRKIPTLDLSTGNKPITIFYGFARNVFLEYLKKQKTEIPIENVKIAGSSESDDDSIEMAEYLQSCLQKLSEIERMLVLQYYSREKSLKFEHRRRLAQKLDLTMGAMHIRIHRIRKALRECIEASAKKYDM